MGLSYNSRVFREDLSLYYDPANPKCYPGSGSTIFDLTNNGNDGTLLGGPVFSNGEIIFDGTNDNISVPSNQDSLNFSQNQTIIIWMKHNFTSGRKNPYNQAYGGYGTWTHESGSNINWYYGNGGGNVQPYTSRNSSTTPRDVWNMMATTRSVSQVKWYRNASLINTGTNLYGTLATTTSAISIGTGYAGRWIGSMGPIMLFKRELSQKELEQIFIAHRGRFNV